MYSPLSSIVSSPSISSPGSVALETAKNLKDQAIFKVPTSRARRSRTKILDEDTYIEKMGEIIQRDFFPDLEKLKAQNEYIEALEHNDVKKMRQLYEKYSFERPKIERLASPATFETPVRKESTDDEMSTPGSSKNEAQPADSEDKKVGLDEFLSTTTSEDNASFEDILVENEKKHRLKYAWLYKMETEPQLALEDVKDRPLAIENGSKNNKPFAVDTWAYKNKNYIMYIPDGVELTTEEKIELAKKRQEVIHSNTRLKMNPFNEEQNKETIHELAKIQSKVNDGKIGIDGKEILKNETPRVNGYAFVASPSPSPMPSPIPSEIMESPILTWGFIDGTPFRLDGGDTPLVHASQGPSFRMAEPPKREKIALQLAEKAGERNRDKKIKALNAARRSLATPSPSPRSSIDRLSTMSPAARRLATQKLRVSVSPSPKRISSSRTPLLGIRTPNMPRVNTPLIKSSGSDSSSKMPVLTDNLLKLPQRQRAADFFNE